MAVGGGDGARVGRIQAQFRRGGMAEWSMAVVLKNGSAGSTNSQISS
jgi:hypothetical protein